MDELNPTIIRNADSVETKSNQITIITKDGDKLVYERDLNDAFEPVLHLGVNNVTWIYNHVLKGELLEKCKTFWGEARTKSFNLRQKRHEDGLNQIEQKIKRLVAKN